MVSLGPFRGIRTRREKPASDIEALPDLRARRSPVVDIRDEATLQLIARYRQEPTLALTALPDIGLR